MRWRFMYALILVAARIFAVLRGAWAIGRITVGVTGAVSVVSTNGATFYVTGVKLEIGSVATPYNRQSLAKSMADCQRYYQQTSNSWILGNPGAASRLLWVIAIQHSHAG